MLTRKRWTPPIIPQGLDEDVRRYLQEQNKSISDYLLSLEGKGSLTINEAEITASSGIKFPATAITSTDANTLADFEKNTWTPAGNGVTFSAAAGEYEKFDRLCIARFDVTWPATADTSEARITGLPFTVANAGQAQGGWIGYTDLNAAVTCIGVANTTYATLYSLAGTSYNNAGVSGKRFVGAAVYRV